MSAQNWYGSGAAGTSYSNYFANPTWMRMPDLFGGLGDIARGALEDNPTVGYGHLAGQIAPNPQSNLYRYLMAQYGRIHNDYDYSSLQNPNQTWTDYMSLHVPQLEHEFQFLSPEMRGERQRFAQGGGRYLG